MSVRDSLLALLTLGPAYGLQLHGELLDRAAHRRRVNVGQIYSTLERLRERGLVEPAGATDDGLPLHALTAEGRAEAEAWLAGEGASGDEEWDDVLDRILVASSVDGADLDAVLDAYDTVDAADEDAPLEAEDDSDHPQRRLAAVARAARIEAVRAVARAARREFEGSTAPERGRGLSAERPRRGRPSASETGTRMGGVA